MPAVVKITREVTRSVFWPEPVAEHHDDGASDEGVAESLEGVVGVAGSRHDDIHQHEHKWREHDGLQGIGALHGPRQNTGQDGHDEGKAEVLGNQDQDESARQHASQGTDAAQEGARKNGSQVGLHHQPHRQGHPEPVIPRIDPAAGIGQGQAKRQGQRRQDGLAIRHPGWAPAERVAGCEGVAEFGSWRGFGVWPGQERGERLQGRGQRPIRIGVGAKSLRPGRGKGQQAQLARGGSQCLGVVGCEDDGESGVALLPRKRETLESTMITSPGRQGRLQNRQFVGDGASMEGGGAALGSFLGQVGEGGQQGGQRIALGVLSAEPGFDAQQQGIEQGAGQIQQGGLPKGRNGGYTYGDGGREQKLEASYRECGAVAADDARAESETSHGDDDAGPRHPCQITRQVTDRAHGRGDGQAAEHHGIGSGLFGRGHHERTHGDPHAGHDVIEREAGGKGQADADRRSNGARPVPGRGFEAGQLLQPGSQRARRVIDHMVSRA
ncbi:MAG: hypothetical protein M0R28_16830 [Pigmentiphaga sp.]|nr:hypothetical protein [Pigmentiphaga sp.]